MYTVWTPQIEGVWVPSVHADCNHNEIAALLKRSLGVTPGSDESARSGVLRVFRDFRRLSARYCEARWSLLETAQSYTGSLRRRYEKAELSLREDGPLTARDVFLKAFLKAEKFNAMAKVAKPRMIFPRDPRYNLVLASWLKPFEHWLWGRLRSPWYLHVPPTRVVAKGLNGVRRANLINRKMKNVGDCVVFEVDGKAFEAHVDVWQLEQEHAVYSAAYPGDGYLKSVLSKQLRNRGVTKHGVEFARDGGRASGDYNTGMGNSLIMLAVVLSVLRGFHLSRCDLLVDGDNALVFLRREDAHRVVSQFAPLALACSGHEMVLERPVSVLEEVRFGQSAPVFAAGSLRMVRDYLKVVSQGTSNHAHLGEVNYVRPYLRGVACCELALNAGVPILGVWAASLLSWARDAKVLSFEKFRDYSMLGVSESAYHEPVSREITVEARESFSRAFGLSPSQQVEIESALRCGLSDLRPVLCEAADLDDWWDSCASAVVGSSLPWWNERRGE